MKLLIQSLFAVALVLSCSNLFAQKSVTFNTSGRYKINTVFNASQFSNNSIAPGTVEQICINNKIKVSSIRTFGTDTMRMAIFRIKTRNPKFHPELGCAEAPSRFVTYVAQAYIVKTSVREPFLTPTFGALALPFKYDPSTAKIYAGGNFGFYVGAQHMMGKVNGDDFSIFLAGTVGYNRIALNNINSQNIENTDDVGALGIGALAGGAIGRFQLVVVYGGENYNINDEKIGRSWISLGLGFGFLNKAVDK